MLVRCLADPFRTLMEGREKPFGPSYGKSTIQSLRATKSMIATRRESVETPGMVGKWKLRAHWANSWHAVAGSRIAARSIVEVHCVVTSGIPEVHS
jgi:hypothetical protein